MSRPAETLTLPPPSDEEPDWEHVARVAATCAADAQARKKRTLSMTWTVADVNVTRSSRGNQLDRFTATGKPFGSSEATTVTRADERTEDRKNPRFKLENEHGWIQGTLS